MIRDYKTKAIEATEHKAKPLDKEMIAAMQERQERKKKKRPDGDRGPKSRGRSRA